MQGPLTENLKQTLETLIAYCEKENYAGWDPYDALNSRLFQLIPFLDYRIPRLVLTQVMKRSPVNFRRLLMVPKTQNPKALALFLSSYIKLSQAGFVKEEKINPLIESIRALRSQGSPYWNWGYSFPWQTRTILVPRGAPNLVCTTFVANALLDAYEAGRGQDCIEMAKSAAAYILDDLYWTHGDSVACFCYPTPSSRSRVHNANFLGAALLARVHHHTGNKTLLEAALRVARYSASKQEADGSWYYGEHPTQRWIDNFHTGYNLCALADIGRYADTKDFYSALCKGFDFYRSNFFQGDGAPKYFYNRLFPIDAHSSAQSIITLIRLSDLDESSRPLASSVFRWSLSHLLSAAGCFYYQQTPYYTNRIPYVRWSQAWMLLALAVFLHETDNRPVN